MNTPQYKKAYLQNLKVEVTNNNKNLKANQGNPSTNQYIQNTGQQVLGVSTFQSTQHNPMQHNPIQPKPIQTKPIQTKSTSTITNVQAKGTKWNGLK